MSSVFHNDLVLDVENFRSWDHFSGDFGACDQRHFIDVSGQNGVGKSSILEAFIFALTGRDSSGGPSPTHLIKKGSERMQVTLWMGMGRWGVSRSLTEKKNGSLKICVMAGIWKNVTQTELMTALNLNEEIIIAALVPGFFMRQPQQKRVKLLSEMTPKIDRNQIVAAMCGVSISTVKGALGDLNVKIPTLTSVSLTRIEKDKQLARVETRMESCAKILEECEVKEPLKDPHLEGLEKEISDFIRAKDAYQFALERYDLQVKKREEIEAENLRREIARRKAVETLESLRSRPAPPKPDVAAYHELIKSFVELPPKPDLQEHTIKGDYCYSCGQAVSISHKEKLKAEREKVHSQYLERYNAAQAHNESLEAQINKLREEHQAQERVYQDYLQECRNSELLKASANRTIAANAPLEVPPMPEIPEYPVAPRSEEDLIQARAKHETHLMERGVFDLYQSRSLKAKNDLEYLKEEAKHLSEQITIWEGYERAIKSLPYEEVALKRNLFGINLLGAEISMEEGFDVFSSDGVPYLCMSAGQRLRIDVEICSKFLGFALKLGEGRPMQLCPIIFVDNADLADWYSEINPPDYVKKVFFAHVVPNLDQVTVKVRGVE